MELTDELKPVFSCFDADYVCLNVPTEEFKENACPDGTYFYFNENSYECLSKVEFEFSGCSEGYDLTIDKSKEANFYNSLFRVLCQNKNPVNVNDDLSGACGESGLQPLGKNSEMYCCGNLD